jgi:tetratricopeptide (TPR) repeat protein
MPIAKRRHLHRRAAVAFSRGKTIVPEVLAYHWARAGDDKETAKWAVRAALRELEVGAAFAAAGHLRDALDASFRLRQPPGQIAKLASQWATAARAAGRPEDVERALRIALANTRKSRARTRLQVERAIESLRAGQLDRARRLLTNARRQIRRTDEEADALIDIELAWVALFRGDVGVAVTTVERVVASVAASINPELGFRAATLLTQIRGAGGLPGASAASRKALAFATAAGMPRLVGIALGNAALVADNSGHWPQAERRYRMAEAAFRRSGDVLHLARAQVNRSSIAIEQGEVDGLPELLIEAARSLAAGGDSLQSAIANVLEIRASVRFERPTDARAVVARIEKALERIRQSGDETLIAFHEVSAVEVLLLTKQTAKANRRANDIMRRVDTFGSDTMVAVTARRLSSIAYRAQDRLPLSGQLLEDASRGATQARIFPEIAAIRTEQDRRNRNSATADTLRLDQQVGVVSRPLW